MVAAIWLHVLTPAQVAHLSVGMDPAPPDMLCVAELLALAAGQSDPETVFPEPGAGVALCCSAAHVC